MSVDMEEQEHMLVAIVLGNSEAEKRWRDYEP